MHVVHKGHSAKVTFPIKRPLIILLATVLRAKMLRENESFFDIVGFLEKQFGAWRQDPEFHLSVVPAEELPGRLGETIPSEHVIRVRESIYLGALDGDGFSRQVIAHELWHYLVHNADTISFAYVDDSSHIPIEMDPEKQANAFAAELLAPSELVCGMKIQQICRIYGVTRRTAAIQKQIGERTAAHYKHTNQSSSAKQRGSYVKKKRSGSKPNRRCR